MENKKYNATWAGKAREITLQLGQDGNYPPLKKIQKVLGKHRLIPEVKQA